MSNLYDETLKVLKEHGKKITDIVAVQGDDFGVSVEQFINIAKDTNYDDGYGGQEVANDLLVIGESWWLERAEYDGAEWWEFKELPKIKRKIRSIRWLNTGDGGWESLKEINSEEQSR